MSNKCQDLHMITVGCSRSQRKHTCLVCKHTHKRTRPHAPSLALARVLIIPCLLVIMRWRAGFASAETVRLCGCARLALTQSQAPAAPASPPSLRHRQAQRGGPNLGWRVELETLLWAPFTVTGSEPCPTPPPEHDQILAPQRAQQHVCVLLHLNL